MRGIFKFIKKEVPGPQLLRKGEGFASLSQWVCSFCLIIPGSPSHKDPARSAITGWESASGSRGRLWVRFCPVRKNDRRKECVSLVRDEGQPGEKQGRVCWHIGQMQEHD